MFDDLVVGTLDVSRLNYGTITLVPKVPEADVIQKFRPICLFNVSLKILTKASNNRLVELANDVLDEAQTAFIKGRFIFYGVAVIHEILNEVHKSNSSGIVFKVDLEKAYDKINCNFLKEVMSQKGFSLAWINCVMSVVTRGKLLSKLMIELGLFFRTYQGVRQGDPLSPILFNLTVDALVVLVKQVRQQGLIRGLAKHLVPGGCVILQYADDTIFLLEPDLDCARNLKFLLCMFEQMSGLKINFHKSDLYCLGGAQELGNTLKGIFTCKQGSFPFRYLGVPLSYKRLANINWKPMEDRVEGRLASWQGRLLSRGDRVTLINSCMSSVPNFLMSFLEIPKSVMKKLDFFRRRMLWQDEADHRKIHLVNWPSVCQPKDQGGLGITDLTLMNFCLICKWIWKLENSSGLWQKLIRRKYCRGKLLAQVVHRQGDSHFWSGILHVRVVFFSFCRRLVGNGKRTRFWEDEWWGVKPLARQFPRLFNLTFSTGIFVYTVFTEGWGSIRFRRTLVGETLKQWEDLKRCYQLVVLSDIKDKLFLETGGQRKIFGWISLQTTEKIPGSFSL